MIVLPGPAFILVPLGFAILACEFACGHAASGVAAASWPRVCAANLLFASQLKRDEQAQGTSTSDLYAKQALSPFRFRLEVFVSTG